MALEFIERYTTNTGRCGQLVLIKSMENETGREKIKNKKGREPRTKNMTNETSKKRGK